MSPYNNAANKATPCFAASLLSMRTWTGVLTMAIMLNGSTATGDNTVADRAEEVTSAGRLLHVASPAGASSPPDAQDHPNPGRAKSGKTGAEILEVGNMEVTSAGHLLHVEDFPDASTKSEMVQADSLELTSAGRLVGHGEASSLLDAGFGPTELDPLPLGGSTTFIVAAAGGPTTTRIISVGPAPVKVESNSSKSLLYVEDPPFVADDERTERTGEGNMEISSGRLVRSERPEASSFHEESSAHPLELDASIESEVDTTTTIVEVGNGPTTTEIYAVGHAPKFPKNAPHHTSTTHARNITRNITRVTRRPGGPDPAGVGPSAASAGGIKKSTSPKKSASIKGATRSVTTSLKKNERIFDGLGQTVAVAKVDWTGRFNFIKGLSGLRPKAVNVHTQADFAIKGPPGHRGMDGQQGHHGRAGPHGLEGHVGPRGWRGAPGPKGPQGPPGHSRPATGPTISLLKKIAAFNSLIVLVVCLYSYVEFGLEEDAPLRYLCCCGCCRRRKQVDDWSQEEWDAWNESQAY